MDPPTENDEFQLPLYDQIDFTDPQPSTKDKNGERKMTEGRKSVQHFAARCRKQCNFLHCFEIVCIIILTTCVVLLYLDSKKLLSPAEESAEIKKLMSRAEESAEIVSISLQL
ncbi:uncharacterized protein LOC108674204 [Hyalella azteca]|uniref:Uncharacterized protein LOC108674204 n=1 Tax=Hyalella azteca TaxID=294128 RepID=A0A8B7NV25_HYAAZ|nr:uncharacterized protein LOC108674204 [Hyalella azteca]